MQYRCVVHCPHGRRSTAITESLMIVMLSHMLYMCTCSGSPHNVMQSSSNIIPFSFPPGGSPWSSPHFRWMHSVLRKGPVLLAALVLLPPAPRGRADLPLDHQLTPEGWSVLSVAARPHDCRLVCRLLAGLCPLTAAPESLKDNIVS